MSRYSGSLLVSLLLIFVLVATVEAEITGKGFNVQLKLRPAELLVTPESLDLGGEKLSQALTLTNRGGSELTWQMTVSDENKLSLSKIQGTLGSEGSEEITVSVKREGLARGTYQVKVQVTSNGGNKEIGVSFSVPNHPPEFIDFPGEQRAYIGDTAELIIKARDADGDALTLTIDPEFPLPGAKIELVESDDVYVWRFTYSSDKPGTIYAGFILDDGQP